MAIFHLAAKPVCRATGRSATASAAYRSASRILDDRTGLLHDYTRKAGVVSADIVLPSGASPSLLDRAVLWNAAEAAERRRDACVAREYEVALPSELSSVQRHALVLDFAGALALRHGVAVDAAIHLPDAQGDPRNHHAHVLTTTRVAGPEGLSGKAEIEKAGRNRRADLESTRELWEDLANGHLERAGQGARIDRRSLQAQGIEREPTSHLGPAIIGFERRTGLPSDVRQRQAVEASARLIVAKALGEIERQGIVVARSVLDLSGDLALAKAARDALQVEAAARSRESAETAERDRRARLPAAALREEIQRLRPPRLEEAVAARPEVVSMQRIVAELDAQQQAQRRAVETAGRESEQWAAAHPMRTHLHELGVRSHPYLAERVAAYDAGTAALASLRSQREVAEAAAARVRETARREVAQAQAPVLAAVGVLEDLYQAKLTSERVAAEQAREREARVKTFTDLAVKRERGVYGYVDAGRAWQALGKEVREAVDAYNRQGAEGRAREQDRLRTAPGQAWLGQAMPARGRAMER